MRERAIWNSPELDNPTSMMWAVIALECLRADIRQFTNAGVDTNEFREYAGALEETLNWFYSSRFRDMPVYYTNDIVEIASRLGDDFQKFSNTFEIAPDRLQCCHNFLLIVGRYMEDYVSSVPSPGATSFTPTTINAGWHTALTDLMGNLLGYPIIDFLHSIDTIPSDQVDEARATFVQRICGLIEDYVRTKAGVMFNHDVSIAQDMGHRMVDSLQPILFEHVRAAALVVNPGPVTQTYYDDLIFCRDKVVLGIACLFSNESSLYYYEPDCRCDCLGCCTHIRLDSDNINYYSDNWYQDSWEADDFRDFASDGFDGFDDDDMLSGPDSATLDDVSTAVEPSPGAAPCDVCYQSDVPMRKFMVCSHGVCASCLDAQLQIADHYRYKCPFCRAEFFPRITLAADPH